jgi:hypothetical protein
MKERQELWCHECYQYVQFNIDVSLNGNHVIKCPVCGHEHCRVVEEGVITDVRWDSRNNVDMQAFNTYMTTGMTSSGTSTYDTYSANLNSGTTTSFRYSAWMNLGVDSCS